MAGVGAKGNLSIFSRVSLQCMETNTTEFSRFEPVHGILVERTNVNTFV